MQVYGSNSYSGKNLLTFGKAQVNILAMADGHNKLEALPGLYSNIENNIDEIFPDKDKKGTLNIATIVGDWFIDPSKKGFRTDENKTNGDYQVLFLNKLIDLVKDKVNNFKAYYVAGNHCFESGDRYLVNNCLSQSNMTTIFSNANFKRSPAISSLPSYLKDKVKQYEILEVEDNKDPNLKHHVLLLGITLSNLDYYNPGLVDGIDLIDRMNKSDAKIKAEDLQKTVASLSELIRDQKSKYKKLAVVLMSHSGLRITNMLASELEKSGADVDLLINAHDHIDRTYLQRINKNKYTALISLWKDNDKFTTVKLKFNDMGDLEDWKEGSFKSYYSKDAPKLNNNPLYKLFKECFRKDLKKMVYIEGPQNITKLSHEEARSGNSLLANMLTDAILENIKKYKPDVQIFGVAASTFRQDLPVNEGINNLDLMNLLAGSVESMSQVYTGRIKGSDLASAVGKCICDNLRLPERNVLIQWSGIQVDKLAFKKIANTEKECDINSFIHYIKIKDKNGTYKPINPDEFYNIAIPNKFFIRSNIDTFKNLKDQFEPINKSLDELFREYLKDNKYKLHLPDENDIRVISTTRHRRIVEKQQ